MLRVGMVGVGTMGRAHSDAYQRMPDVAKVGVYDIDPERAVTFAQEQGWSAAYGSFEEMIAAVDFVDVCTPTPTHAGYVLSALYGGHDVVCEKPMARTLADCALLIEAARETGRTLMPAQVLRFFPEYSSATRIVQSGEIGNPATVRTRRGGGFPHGSDDWYADFAQSGGVTLDMIIHDFDWLRWTFGPVASVYAKAASLDPSRSTEPRDYALVTLTFVSGVVAQVEGTWAEPGGFSVSLEVTGDSGMIHFDSTESVPLRISRRQTAHSDGVVVPESPTSTDPYYLELRHFVDCLKAATRPSITPEDGYYAVEIALAALESARVGNPIVIPVPREI
ncbi:MAG: Gfo/Idh/MocA family oxidoreductase [Fibrella sp.]|nr:Gfo/Idh/MocA family oxidoreductase [Armatimonadota bacterium]